MGTGIPNFVDLTKYVIDESRAPEGSDMTEAFKPYEEQSEGPKLPLDQIFDSLFR
jgi:hypothetical protein